MKNIGNNKRQNKHQNKFGITFDTILPIFILLMFICGCSAVQEGLTDTFGGYTVKDGKVTYHTGMQGLGTRRSWELTEADAATFTVLRDEYAKDKNHAYLDGILIPEADGATFEILKKPYALDSAHVFLGAAKISDSPANFKIVAELEKGTFSTDGKKVFFGSAEFLPSVVDAATFEQIGSSSYFRDNRHVYTQEKKIESADPKTFEVTIGNNGMFARDKDSVFFNAVRVEGCDVKTHEIIQGRYHEDSKSVFYGTQKITDDVKEFEILKSLYSRDSKHVYWQADKISDDVDHFVAFPTDVFEAYAKDSRAVYRCDHKAEDVDIASFTGLDHRYAKDKKNVYFEVGCDAKKLSTVDGADPETFIVIKGDNVDAMDKTNNYNFGTNRGPR